MLHVPPYIGSQYTECLTKGICWPPLQTLMWWYIYHQCFYSVVCAVCMRIYHLYIRRAGLRGAACSNHIHHHHEHTVTACD